QRTEEQLIQAKDALEARSAELARSLAMMRATLEATSDGIMVTDGDRRVTNYNQQYVQMWRLPDGLLDVVEHRHPADECTRQLVDPSGYLSRIEEIYACAPQETFDLLELADARYFERSSRIQFLDGRVVGRVWSYRDVSESKRTEQALLRQSEWLRITLSSIGDGVVATDGKGCVTFLNEVATQLTGWSMADAAGRPLADVFHIVNGHSRVAVENPALRALRMGMAVGLTSHTILIARDGSERPIEDSAAPMRDASGDMIGAVLVFRDVTERQRANETQIMMAAIVESSEDAIISKDLQGTIKSWNRGAERLFGYMSPEAVGRSITLIIPPHLIDEEQTILKKLRRGERIEHFETMRVSKTGRQIDISLTISPVRDHEGRVMGVSKIARDITELKLARNVIAWEAQLLANVRDAVVVTDLEGIVTHWNAGAQHLFGWTVEEALGRHYSERFPASARSSLAEELKAHATDIQWSGEYEAWRKDGSRVWIDARISPFADAQGRLTGILGLAHDITERRRAEEALRDADRRKDEFLALLAHELRNPLAPLRNGLQVMRLAAGDANAVAQARAMMDRQLGHMVRLVDDLLDLSRIGQNKMELRRILVSLKDVIDNAVETARPAIEAAGHELTVTSLTGDATLDADLTRLAQVFSNLLTNSAKYTERGGHIWLTTEQCANEVIVTVRDTGIGIPADALPTVFNMFSQVDRSNERATGGLGIGLALVKGFVEMHGGSVTARSDGRGKGSTFTVRLPLAEAAQSPLVEKQRENEPVRARGRRILVVDDNQDAARSMARVLSLRGDEVLAVHDGMEAINSVETFRPHVILLDVGMPQMNGYEAARRIREHDWGRNAVIIAVTGWGQEGDRIESREAGCDGHLVKPVDLQELEKLMTALTHARRAAEIGSE
ncbi:MAG TPA: PAS domain S-box protein, partial [Xanthomonadaceae bacterium]|nr:PAS domain S-box protein [Xanthomonadaceae bacterium]